MEFCRHESKTGAWVLTLHIQPGASRTEVVGKHGDALKIRLAAPPVDGRANQVLLRFLAEQFQLSLDAVELRSGLTGRHKRVALYGLGMVDPMKILLFNS
ncbi:DUF167 domain-containing protein [Ferrovum myxofaciens]|jgi:hypothetical protein|uniref:UPF0235 protein FEMY_05270 n=2 Tax=root TaxID=1 RepID=A0A859ACK9_9PROT|nr:DUF167 family protein [Ferrovum myxofaciens]MBW8029087.1 YggU family protein [Ferrovum sp.]KXW59005.1 hypothetical protein FEMY_05270 [Ferrovum myxofaciens]MBU6993827.1 YggU family protein [Ferrovum myxofaciens]NDU89771.1 YggU family protein [Ferrovum sp.]QKE39677.1 MAG: YggU family protein [Ferrovum myxofaciens]